MKKLRITIEGKAYEVLVEMLDESPSPAPASPRPAPAPSTPPAPLPATAPAATPSGALAKDGDLPSPLAGKVVSIDVVLGQPVHEGAQVATIEAMKMNTYLYAPRAGTIAAILVAAGDGVEEGAPILRIA
jgi:biotin carboxyl carrier protein